MALTEIIGSLINHSSPGSVVLVVGVILFLAYLISDFHPSRSRSIPLINTRQRFEFTDSKAKQRYLTNAKELLQIGFQTVRLLLQPLYISLYSTETLVPLNSYREEPG